MSIDWKADSLIRKAALEWLANAKRKYPQGAIPSADTIIPLPEPLNGVREIRALSPQTGIWKPKQMQACLSLLSSVRQLYDDYFIEDIGVINYKYRTAGGYNHSDNRSLRLAMELQLPILYFHGISRGLYEVNVVRVVQESTDQQGVQLEMLDQLVFLDGVRRVLSKEYENKVESRFYTIQQLKRIRQAEFRQRVMKAYSKQCAVCNLKSEPLLDAAHIIPHSQSGQPEVPNGLSLCKIHHSAYDQNMLGISPDYLIHVNSDMLSQRDGPMLRHGFQERNREKIYIPRKQSDYPDRDKLDQRFEEFKQAS